MARLDSCWATSFFFSRFQREKKGLSSVKKLKAFSLSHGGAVVRWCGGAVVRWCGGAESLKSKDRFPAGPRSLLRWFQSRRNPLGRMKNVWLFSNWHSGLMHGQVCGVRSPRGRGSIPSLAKNTFRLVSEWKKKD